MTFYIAPVYMPYNMRQNIILNMPAMWQTGKEAKLMIAAFAVWGLRNAYRFWVAVKDLNLIYYIGETPKP